MAFEGLSEKLQGALAEDDRARQADARPAVKEGMREVRMALLEADVNFTVVKDFIKQVTERAVGAGDAGQPDARPAGHQDRQRGNDHADGRHERTS